MTKLQERTAKPGPADRPTRSSPRTAGRQWALLALAMAALILWPLVKLQARVVDDLPGALGRMVAIPGLGRIYLDTVIIAAGSTAVAVVSGTGLAWCLTRVPRRLYKWMSLLPIVPLLMPSVASVQGWSYLLSPRTGIINRYLREWGIGSGDSGPLDVYSMAGIILLTGIILTSFVFMFVSASLRQRGAELEAAAAACGASPGRTFLTVTLPMMRPALVYSTAIVLLLALGQFTVPLLLGTPDRIDVVSTAVYKVSADYPVDYSVGGALAVPLLLVGLVVILVQRRALRDERRYVSVSARSRQVGLTTSRWALVPIVGYLVVAVILPLGALVSVSLSPFWSGRISPSTFTLDNWVSVWSDRNTVGAITTTLYALLITLVIVLPLSYLVSVALLRRTRVPGSVRLIVDILSSIALCMPVSLLGFAFLFTYSEAPFRLYGTTAMVVVAYVTLTIPFAIRPQLSALTAIGPEYAEASRISGAGSLGTARRISFPLIRSGLGVSAALVTIIVAHEFTVSLMVTSPTRRVIGSLLYDETINGSAPDVAVLSLLMLAVTLVGIAISWVIAGGNTVDKI
ncbi:iron ABC transporter permease [Pseudonocardia sp. N23]|uniref:ABC transporter permease n=1 Tax=Pseudonocardia sp. N23 TaxID=1987376 RepID=UPI000BFD209C|nr:ABC transporter permease subunit [Pseudonocardia sp. N23]GAY07653.1 ferric iron ABC transporter, permease protein [Pseudonocardia sp. N23]